MITSSIERWDNTGVGWRHEFPRLRTRRTQSCVGVFTLSNRADDRAAGRAVGCLQFVAVFKFKHVLKGGKAATAPPVLPATDLLQELPQRLLVHLGRRVSQMIED